MSQQINLFNPAFQRQKKIFTSGAMLQALAVLLVGMTALVAYGRYSVGLLEREARQGATLLTQKKNRQAAVMTEFAPRQKSKAIEEQVAQAEADLAGLHEVSAVLKRGDFGSTSGYAEYFKALARQGAPDLWLTGVTIAAAGHRIDLRGRAMDASLVPAYIKRLTRETAMRGKSFGSLDISRAELKPAVAKDDKEGRAPRPAELAPYIDFSLQALPEPAPAAPNALAAVAGVAK